MGALALAFDFGDNILDSRPGLNIDVAPTMPVSWAAWPIPDLVQGRSLMPLFEDDPASTTGAPSSSAEHLFERSDIPKSEGLRTADTKYLRYFDAGSWYTRSWYDLRTDPHEFVNLATEQPAATHERLAASAAAQVRTGSAHRQRAPLVPCGDYQRAQSPPARSGTRFASTLRSAVRVRRC